LAPNRDEVLDFFTQSAFLQETGQSDAANRLECANNRLMFDRVSMNSYLASATAELLRQNLIARKVSLTIETVMSHPSKVEVLRRAQATGYRTYLYFVATDDPEISISRVRSRARFGGHDVPDDKIVQRYYRSLDLLIDAIRLSNRAYIFDNSSYSQEGKQTWLAEITDGKQLVLKIETIPGWFVHSVLNKIR